MNTMNTTTAERLYAEVAAAYDEVSIAACKEIGLYTPLATPGKMTGMILDAAGGSEEAIRELLENPTALADVMVDCVLTLMGRI